LNPEKDVMKQDKFVFGKYEVIGRPRAGGMGVVVICRDQQLDRVVAIKVLRPEYFSQLTARERFIAEGAAWVSLGSHPHVVRCYEVIRSPSEGMLSLVLQFITNEYDREDPSMRSFLRERGVCSTADALLFSLQIARAMEYADRCIPGIVHRDLKPENVLVSAGRLPGTAVNRVLVTDFGLVRVLSEASRDARTFSESQAHLRCALSTRAGRFVGTPEYAAPEQFFGKETGRAADMYALGCITYEMLVGRPPFVTRWRTQEERLAAYSAMHTGQQPDRLDQHGYSSQPPVQEFVSRCLEKNPQNRFGSWIEVVQTLTTVYGKVVGQRPPELRPGDDHLPVDAVADAWSRNFLGFSYC
jgi:eukaryotic-like serine/threonine-protein kinase